MKISPLLLSLAMVFGVQTFAKTSDMGNTKIVNGVKWTKQRATDTNALVSEQLPQGVTSIFFIRPQDADSLATSANIAINDRFQTSLQPGNYSHVYSCSGINKISGEITGNKNNDLLKNALTFNLESANHFFFYVDVDDKGTTTIKHITKNDGIRLMQDMPQQTHQISRVVPNCPVVPVYQPIVVVAPPPPQPVQEQRYSIDLEVLFDTDKHFVKPQYMSRIAEVAQFLQAHPTAVASIEGHTDSRASDEYNQDLSQRRVNAVRKILIDEFGISPDRLNAVGYGESRPIASNDTPEGRKQNRRVVAVFDNY